MKILSSMYVLLLLVKAALCQIQTIPATELQEIMFTSEVNGVVSTLINPAGLSRLSNDDGAFLNYSFNKTGNKDELNFLLSMGNLAFGVQEHSLDLDNNSPTVYIYQLSISVGGRIFSIGTSNKLVELRWPHHARNAFSVDAGFVFNPVSWFGFGAFARNLDERTIENYRFPREYIAGFGIRLHENRVKLLAQSTWNDHTVHLENASYKAGLVVSPMEDLDFYVGAVQHPTEREQFFIMFQIPIWGGIRLLSSARMDEHSHFQRYTASILIPLRTVTF